MTMPVHSIFDTEPASRWEDAFLAGNGEYGIMVFGDPRHERIVHNHHRYVLPNGSLGLRPPAVAARLGRVRELILCGEREQAQREFSDGRELAWTQPFHPGHVLHIDAADVDEAAQEYRRTVSFRTGEVAVEWATATGRYTRRAFVSRADAVAVLDISGPELDLNLRLGLDMPGRPPSIGVETRAWATPGGAEAALSAFGRYPQDSHSSAVGFLGVTRLVAEGGELTADADVVHVRGARRVLLLTRMDRPHAEPDPEILRTSLAALPTNYDDLLERHVAIHGGLYAASALDLGVSDVERTMPVRELLERTTGDLLDPLVAEALFHSGRYLLLSSCGTLPPRLTGLWLGQWGAAWSGDFTTDANINLQISSAILTGMPELLTSYTALVADQIEDWRTNARTIYGARGILAPSRTDGEHGLLFHLDDEWPWAMWVAGADWLLLPLHEYWQATGDDEFLADTLAPWLIEAALFFEDFLAEAPRDDEGRYVLVPSYSPEVGPRDVRGVAGVNAAMDIAAARHALLTAAEACSLLGIEPEADERWRSIAARLPDYRLDADGVLAEWAWPGLETALDHRHISHLHPVWPLYEINPDQTPQLADAARLALLRRGDENLSAHGSLHRALCAARLKDTDTARTNLRKILDRNMIFRSLMTSHNPDLETYNADAAHTLPAVFAEMLVGSRPGSIELLPALPAEWARGSVLGLGTRAFTTVEELHWDLADSSARVVLSCAREQSIVVSCRGGRQVVNLPAGTPVSVTFQLAAAPSTSAARVS
jgi:hypothetical protein